MENFHVFDRGSICIHGKELLRQFAFHQKYRWKTHFEADVREMWTVDVGKIRWDFWSVSNQLGKFFMETVIIDQWWRSQQSLACKKFFVFSDSVLCLGKVNQNPTSNTVWEEQLVERVITIQNFEHNWRRTDGIPLEYFPRIHYIAARPRSPKVHVKLANQNNSKDESYSCQCPMTSNGEIKDNETECAATSTRVSLFAKRFPAGHWSFLGLGSETKSYSTNKERPRGKWDRFAALMMIEFE